MDKSDENGSKNANEAAENPIARLLARLRTSLPFLLIHIAAGVLLAFAVELGGSTLLWLAAYVFLSWSAGLTISLLRSCGKLDKRPDWSGRVETIFYAAPLVVTGFLWMRADAVFDAAREELRTQCEKDAGLTISRTVMAKGYYESYNKPHQFWQGIINSDYEFIEACYENPIAGYALGEPGCWRVTKIKRNTQQCHPGIDKQLKGLLTYQDFWEKYCFEAQFMNEPSARYGVFYKTTSWKLEDRLKSKLYRNEIVFRDLEKKEVLAREIYYELFSNPNNPVPTAGSGCRDFNDGYQRNFDLVPSILKPK